MPDDGDFTRTNIECDGIVVRNVKGKVHLEVSCGDGERFVVELSVLVAARLGYTLLDAAKSASAAQAWREQEAEEAKKAKRS
jgi:hypothetical protein